jgi:hypothetical protein
MYPVSAPWKLTAYSHEPCHVDDDHVFPRSVVFNITVEAGSAFTAPIIKPMLSFAVQTEERFACIVFAETTFHCADPVFIPRVNIAHKHKVRIKKDVFMEISPVTVPEIEIVKTKALNYSVKLAAYSIGVICGKG